MATCTANYRFVLVDIGAPGRQSDGGVFKNSLIGQLLASDSLHIPSVAPVSDGGPRLPYVFVADEAFQLSEHIMRPYPRCRQGVLPLDKRIFNYRLSRARRMIENCFGILVANWRIFRRPINTCILTARKIVQASVCLHNFIMEYEERLPITERIYSVPSLCDGDGLNNYQSITRNFGSNMHSASAAQIRDKFKEFFNGAGAVPWQVDRATNCTY